MRGTILAVLGLMVSFSTSMMGYPHMAKSSSKAEEANISNDERCKHTRCADDQAHQAAGPNQKIAQVEVKLGPKLGSNAVAGIRTLYLIVYDLSSERPMPYSALKVDLDKDAQGTFYKGVIETANMMVMSGGPVPDKMKIKARLDKDGYAGKDEPGDLVGLVEGVKPGTAVNITIDRLI